jgi:hypothetical protein
MKTKRISAVVIIESGDTQDYIILPTGDSGIVLQDVAHHLRRKERRKTVAPADKAVGQFVMDRLFELQVGDKVTVKWRDVFQIEDEPGAGKGD